MSGERKKNEGTAAIAANGRVDRNVVRHSLNLLTYGHDGRQDSVTVGSTVSVCVRRARARQMYWYPATVVALEGDRAWVELKNHKGERALLGARSIRCRDVTHNAALTGRGD